MSKTLERRQEQYEKLRLEREECLKKAEKLNEKMLELFASSESEKGSGQKEINYYSETLLIFQQNPTKVFSAKTLLLELEKKFGKGEVDIRNVKATLFYASKRKGTIKWVERGRYKLKTQENMETKKSEEIPV